MKHTFAEVVAGYLADTKKRCAAVTTNHYEKRLSSLVKEFGHRPIDELTAADIKDNLERHSKWPSGESKAPDTIRTVVIAWEQLQRWAIENELLQHAITKKKLPKPGGRKRELIPTKDETKSLLDATPPDFHAIYKALRLTGARPGELCSAEIKHLDRVAGEIVLTKHKTAAKTGKPRRIPVGHPSLIQIITECIGDRTEGHIFLRSNGRPWYPQAISWLYREARRAAGLREGLVPYLARHEHATALYKTLGDIKAVADALGHTQISTTMRYTRVDLGQMQKNQQAFDDSLD